MSVLRSILQRQLKSAINWYRDDLNALVGFFNEIEQVLQDLFSLEQQ